jgi:hypothetical protein
MILSSDATTPSSAFRSPESVIDDWNLSGRECDRI